MPTKIQNEGRKNFFKYSKRFDNLNIRYYSLGKSHVGYSYYVAIQKSKDVQFRIKIQKNRRYQVITEKKSSVKVPRELSVKRFDTAEEALDAVAKKLVELGYKAYTSNAINFIMGDD